MKVQNILSQLFQIVMTNIVLREKVMDNFTSDKSQLCYECKKNRIVSQEKILGKKELKVLKEQFGKTIRLTK